MILVHIYIFKNIDDSPAFDIKNDIKGTNFDTDVDTK